MMGILERRRRCCDLSQRDTRGLSVERMLIPYRANTARAFRELARVTGFELTRTQAIEHYPYYLMFSPALFRLGILYDEIVRALGLVQLQSTWLVVMEKN